MDVNVNMHELNITVDELLHEYRQLERLKKEKSKINKNFKRLQNELMESLTVIKKRKLKINALDGKYEITVETKPRKKGMSVKERNEYIDNLVVHDLSSEEMSQTLKTALCGDVNFIDQICIKKIE